ncbi:MAG: hypothetical protein AAGI14_04420 [Pseudomonadota bacterium]
MSFRKSLLAGAVMVASTVAVSLPASASVIDRPHFKVLGLVVVWSGDGTGGAIANDFVIGTTDLIGGTAQDGTTVLTGSLDLTTDATVDASTVGDVLDLTVGLASPISIDETTPSLTAFDPSAATLTGEALTYESSFYVASNTAFNINAVATETTQSGDFEMSDVSYSLGVTVTDTDGGLTFGGNAQDPQGTFNPVTDFSNLDGTTDVYEGGRRTAESAGSLVGQSVRFDATYALNSETAYDLSQGAGELEAEVVYTVYVP